MTLQTPPPRALPCTLINMEKRSITPEPEARFSYSQLQDFPLDNGLLPSAPLPKPKSPKLKMDSPLLQSSSAIAKLSIFTIAAQNEDSEEDTPPQTPQCNTFATPELSFSSPDSASSQHSSPDLSTPRIQQTSGSLGLAFEDMALSGGFRGKHLFQDTTCVYVRAILSPISTPDVSTSTVATTLMLDVDLKSSNALSILKCELLSRLSTINVPLDAVTLYWQQGPQKGGNVRLDDSLPLHFRQQPYLLATLF